YLSTSAIHTHPQADAPQPVDEPWSCPPTGASLRRLRPRAGVPEPGRPTAHRRPAAPRRPPATWCRSLVRSSTSVDGVVDDPHGPGARSDVISDAQRLWSMCATLLRAQVSDPVWHTAFEGVRAVDYDSRSLILGVPSALAKERIEGRYLGLVRDALAEA